MLFQVVLISGMQWGDEGKGKLVSLLSKDFDLVARYNGIILIYIIIPVLFLFLLPPISPVIVYFTYYSSSIHQNHYIPPLLTTLISSLYSYFPIL